MNAAGRPRSDFLGGIVDRAFERAAVIAPRPTSLFEPVAAAPAPLPEADGEDAHAAFGTSIPAAAERAPAEPGRGAIQVSAPAPMMPAAPVARAAHVAAESASARIAPPFARESSPAQTLLRETHVHTLERETAPALLVVREAAVAATAATASRAQSDAGEGTAAVPPARDATPAHPDPLAAPLRASLLPERAITAGFEAHAARGRADAAPLAQAAAPPNVTISIGRVEVRAAAAPAQPPAAKSVRQPMRLDEYLARKERTR